MRWRNNHASAFGAAFFIALWVADQPPVVAAGIYKWVDQQGKVHYGDRPTGSDAQAIRLKEAPKVGSLHSGREEKRDRLLQVFEEQRQERREQAATQKKEKEERQRNCNLAKDQLRNYETAGYIYELDKKGDKVILDEAKHAAVLERAKDAVKQWCGKT